MSVRSERALFMSAEHQSALRGLSRTHQNCLAKTGVRRPGKTAQEKSRRSAATRPVAVAGHTGTNTGGVQ